MALLQKFPLFTPRPFCDVTVPNRSSKPVTAMEFRRGGQLSQVVDKVLKTSRLHINAATGAGKSTAFPLALTKAYTNGLVVLVLPFDPMVASLYMFLKNNDAGVQAYWIRDVETPFPKEGLVIVSAATIVARWLSAGNVLLPECIVLHDESHESGVASELIRLVMPVNETVACYVTMTATDPEAHVRNAEMPGKILRSTYDPTAFSDPWSVLDVGAPWMVDQLKGGTLIFEDSDERAQALTQAYKSAAITVFRWTSATKPHLFLADVALMNEPGALCVAIADSSFRSGYTLPLATIVDSGYVTRTITKSDGAIGQIRRPIYQSEMIQSSARGGRLQGLTTRYTRPIGECPDKFCVLEQADVEALAMLCKFMKIELPDMVSRASMVHRGFPADLHAALNAEIPLASHKSELLLSYDEFVKKNCPPMQAKLSTDSGDIGLGRSSSGSNRMKNPFDDLASAIDDLDLSQEDGGDLICGMYAVVTDTVSNSYEDFNLPNAHTSVRKAIGDLSSDATLHIWSKTTRAVALNLAVRTYNTYIMQVKGTAAGVADMSKRRNEIRGSIWHKWVEDTKDSAAVLTAHAHYWFDAILYLSRGFAIVMNADIDFAEEESDVKKHVVQSLSRMMRVSVKPAVLPVCKKKAVCGGSVSSSSSRSSSGSSDRRLDTKRLTNGGMFAETAYYFLVSGNRERQLREAIRNPKPHRRNSSLGSADSF